MENYRILRLYRALLYISLILSSLYWIGTLLTVGFRNFLLLVVTIIIAAISVVSIIALIQLITLTLNLDKEISNTQHELSQAKKSLREVKRELESLKNSIASLLSTITPTNLPTSSPPPPPSTVQVRARVRSDDTLFMWPGGETAIGVNGQPLKVLAGQGVYLTARSADAKWYKFSPDRVSFGWLSEESLQIADIEMVDHLPVEE